MKLIPMKASILALALFSASAVVEAGSADATRLMQVAQAEGESQAQPEPMIEEPPLPPFDPQQAQPEPQIEEPPLPPFDPQQAQPEPQPRKTCALFHVGRGSPCFSRREPEWLI